GPRYDIVVWAGLDPDSYEYPTLTPGTSTITDFQLKVKGYENYMIEREGALEPLWHGKLLGVTFETEKEYRLSLMKDTKKFRLVIQTLDEFDSLTKEDLDIILMSSGGWYDNDNNVLDPKGRGLIYFPYYMIDDPDTGVAIEINSMRLMNEDDRIHRLIINDAKEGYQILNIPLMKYLNALRLLEFSHIPFQEYLDREDTYNILIFLRKEDDGGEKPQPPRGNWVSVKIMINDWVIRFQDIN
ncbi:FimB/Mfa2 family fimbrial subunit, partial [Parabacteroides sp. OttesenSCG-928-K15]|nr:FimB/Mfa2 family fimbrial subunit [Parabacteroides sp. OttesenSCG-928-K15]